MSAKFASLALALGLACLAQVALAAPQTERDQCLRRAAVYLAGIPHGSPEPDSPHTGGAWIPVLEKSREFYPNFEELLLTTSPKAGYVEAMLSLGVLYGFDTIDEDCKLIIDRVDEMPTQVSCFENYSESPIGDLRELMKLAEGIEPVIERYLICHYVANRI